MLKFTGRQTLETPYCWEYVYRVETLIDNDQDYVFADVPKPPYEGIHRGEFRRDDVLFKVIVATYEQDYPVISGRMFAI